MKSQKQHYAWKIVIGSCFLQGGCLGILYNCAGTFMAFVPDEIACGRAELALYITIMGVIAGLIAPWAGKMLATKNINVLMSVMAIIATGAFACMGLFTAPWMWYISGAIIGFASAFLFFLPVPMMIRNWFKVKQGLALGITSIFAGIGGAVMNVVLAQLCTSLGWRQTYPIAALISICCTLPFTMFVLKLRPEDKGLRPYGEEETSGETVAQAKPGEIVVPGMSTGRAAKSGVLFLLILVGALMSFVVSFSQNLSPYGASVGLEAAAIGLISSCSMIGNIVGKLVLGAVKDKRGIRVAVIVGYVVCIISGIFLMLNGGQAILLYIGAFCYGWGMSLVSVILPLVVGEAVGGKSFPTLFGYSQLGVAIFGSIGITICAALKDLTGTYTVSILLITIVSALCIPIILLTLSKAKKVGFDPES